MKPDNVWLIWEIETNGWFWVMYEQDGHLAIFDSKETAEKFVADHPWAFKGRIKYSCFPLMGKDYEL